MIKLAETPKFLSLSLPSDIGSVGFGTSQKN